MTDRELGVRQDGGNDATEQDTAGTRLIQAWFPTAEEREDVVRSLGAFGFASTAEGVRTVLRVFARTGAVRDAVKRNLHRGVLDPGSSEAGR